MPPFFSIIIPTKNRSTLLANSLHSVLSQTFTDFEVLVVDNDDTDATLQVINQLGDARVRHIRTGGLAMSENWDRGFHEASGEYILIIGDKHVLVKHALSTLYETIRIEEHPQVVLWLLGVYYISFGTGYLKTPHETHQVSRLDTYSMLKAFTTETRPNILPDRAYNSATHRSVIQQMLTEGAKRVCMAVAPDYTIIFQHLAYCTSLTRIETVLSITTHDEIGNGFLYNKKTNSAKAQEFIESSGGEEVFYSHVPIRSATIERSFLFNDYLRVRELIGKNLAPYDIDMKNYFWACLLDLMKRRFFFGSEISSEICAWKTALRQQPFEVQQALTKQRRLAWRMGLYWLAFKWLRRVVLPLRLLRLKWQNMTFNSVFDALNWIEGQRQQ